ncbi:hypothetical protein [Natronorarus salvus]|uniref:hypothetical protein n=1 Tax=Natronorarus salvus TaxID=3117733 RepID=UPI002F265560
MDVARTEEGFTLVEGDEIERIGTLRDDILTVRGDRPARDGRSRAAMVLPEVTTDEGHRRPVSGGPRTGPARSKR